MDLHQALDRIEANAASDAGAPPQPGASSEQLHDVVCMLVRDTMLRSHLNAIEAVLLAESRAAANAGHPNLRGGPREWFIENFLSTHLPSSLEIGQGEIIDAGSVATMRRSVPSNAREWACEEACPARAQAKAQPRRGEGRPRTSDAEVGKSTWSAT